MLRKGLPNREKQSASRIVDFPSPFLPMIRVVVDLFSKNIVNICDLFEKYQLIEINRNDIIVHY